MHYSHDKILLIDGPLIGFFIGIISKAFISFVIDLWRPSQVVYWIFISFINDIAFTFYENVVISTHFIDNLLVIHFRIDSVSLTLIIIYNYMGWPSSTTQSIILCSNSWSTTQSRVISVRWLPTSHLFYGGFRHGTTLEWRITIIHVYNIAIWVLGGTIPVWLGSHDISHIHWWIWVISV